MKNVKQIWLILALLIPALSIYAQDIHFSQYFANPISYNPAHTAFFNGSYRLGVNHKQQWPWAIDGKFLNYNSSSAFADFSMLDNRRNNNDWMGIGFNFINDQAGDGNLTANKAYISYAYHKSLDRSNKHQLSAGFTAGYVHRSINFNALYFNNQWVNRVGFDLTIPSNENLQRENTGYLDLGFGLQSNNKMSDKVTLLNGFSMLHINQPKESFYNQDNRLGIRYLAHTMVLHEISQLWDIQYSGYYTFQKKASELMFGALAGAKTHNYSNKKTSKLYIGTFYRLKDALSPIVGYQYHQTRLLMNYDINLSSLTKASRGNGGFELSLVHVGTFSAKINNNGKVNCPKF